MTTLVAGYFETTRSAREALSDLLSAGFAPEYSTLFTPHTQAPATPPPVDSRGKPDEGIDRPAEGAASGAAVGGAVGLAVGLAALPILGPVAVAAAGAGAYVGSLYGALGSLNDSHGPSDPDRVDRQPKPQLAPEGHTLVAVCAPEPTQQQIATRILNAHGATDIDHSEGTIQAGEWIDFGRKLG